MAGGQAPPERPVERPPPERPSISLQELERWEDNGATWRPLEVTEGQALLELCTCYGEPVDTVRGTGAELIAYVRSRRGD